jgi:hypothetical protein
MSTALATQSTALGSTQEEERAYLLGIMAEQLGIPAEDSHKPKVQALIANAVDRNREFGWKPGIHMHVQSFMANVKDDRNQNTGEKERVYVLVDGEKSWRDSIAQWRIQHGVILRYQRKPMSMQEVEIEARSMGFQKPIPNNAAGVWCRIIEHGVDNPNDPDFPEWSSGIWFGSIKTGTYFSNDNLPTGVTPRDVAIRRADKRSAMQSTFVLLPVDQRTPDERSADLARTHEAEAKYRNPTPPDTAQVQRYVVEEDGDILWASTEPEKRSTEPEKRSTEPVDVEFREGVPVDDEVDGSTEEVDGTEDNPFEDDDFSPYAELYHNPDYELADTTKSVMETLKKLQEESKRKMSASGYTMLRDRFVEEEIIFSGTPFTYFLEAATMTHIPGELPGALIGKALMEMLNDERKPALKQIGACVETIYMEMTEE